MTVKQIFDLPIGAGMYTEQSERGAMGRWYQADKVRFRKGLAEKIGGWVQLSPQFLGTCRRFLDWSSLDGKRWTAIATDSKLYLWQDSNLYDITPLRASGTLTNPFDTTNTSTTVEVNDVAHGAQVGDYVRFSGASAVGGITIDGEYQVESVTDADTYTIVHSSPATSTVSGGGGTVAYEYDISVGGSTVTVGTGYGTGPYGREGYGNARTGSNLTVAIRLWSLDTWGEDLLACPRGGAIYWWDRSLGTGSRAVALGSEAPPINQHMIVSQRNRHVFALGAYDDITDAPDPLLIRWNSSEDLQDWEAEVNNTAGDLRIYQGSRIVTGIRSRLEILAFTDVSMHSIQYLGAGDFGINTVGENISILGPNAAVSVDVRVFFMAEADFYIYDGILRVLPCDVRNFVYDNINVDQRDKVYCGLNREFNEIWWFYPSFEPLAWVHDDVSLRLPTSYRIATGSNVTGDSLFDEVELLAKFEGSDGATAYSEVSSNGAAASFSGNAEIDTAQANFGSSSLALDGTGDYVSFSDIAAYTFGSNDFTIEAFVRFSAIPTSGNEVTLISQWGAGGNAFALQLATDGFGTRWKGRFNGSSEVATISPTPSTDIWYHMAIVREGTNVYGYFNGAREFNGTGVIAGALTGSSEAIRIGSLDGSTAFLDGWIDDVRITIGTARYTGASYTVPAVDLPETGSGPANVGYTYTFNSGGYIEAIGTADNGYEHDYFLTNDEPIETPLEAEYVVEMDINPSIAANLHGGLVFLKQDITDTGQTDADDYSGFFVTLDDDNDRIEIRKKEPDGTFGVPDNAGTGNATGTSVLGEAIALGQKYAIKAQVDTPQITVWVDDIQVFQFDMSAQELLDHTGGSAGFHVRASASNANGFRFYNFAATPLNVATQSTFDISPIEVNRYVIFNYEENTWATGTLSRTAWHDRSPTLEKPFAAGADRYLYQHETGVDDNGSAMPSFIESFDMEIPEAGEHLMHIDQLIPDFLKLEGSVNMYLYGRKYPHSGTLISKGPYPVTSSTTKVSTRMRARQVSLKIESTGLGDRWRMATLRGRAGPHGKRA